MQQVAVRAYDCLVGARRSLSLDNRARAWHLTCTILSSVSIGLTLLMAGCQPIQPSSPFPVSGTIALPAADSQTPSVSASTETTATTLTPPPPATPTSTVKYFSVEPDAEQMKSADMAGKVLLTGPGRYRHFLYDLQSREIAELPGIRVDFTYVNPLQVSPDRTAFAYTEITSQGTIRVYVGTNEGKSLAPYLIPNEGRFVVVGWLDDNSISLADMKATDGVIWVMSSADGTLSQLNPPFPLVTDDGPLAWGAGWVYAHYNRERSHVATARWIDNQVDVQPFIPMRFTYELWDVGGSQPVWMAVGGGGSSIPAWDSPGNHLLVAYPPWREVVEFGTGDCSELHVVGTQGEDRMLDPCTWQGGYSWSPDASRVAAWEGWRFTGWDDRTSRREARLRVFDLTYNSVAEYFLRFPEELYLDRSQPPTWSPDARFVAFSELDEGAGPRRSWVLDLETGTAGVLMSGTRVEGWLQQPR